MSLVKHKTASETAAIRSDGNKATQREDIAAAQAIAETWQRGL